MTTREFIVRLANGEFSKNDILQYAASVPDVSDLYWELWFSMYAVPEGFTKPIVEEYKHKYITNAMQILVTKYGYDDLVQPEAKGNIQPKQTKPKRGRPVKPLADVMLNDNTGGEVKETAYFDRRQERQKPCSNYYSLCKAGLYDKANVPTVSRRIWRYRKQAGLHQL